MLLSLAALSLLALGTERTHELTESPSAQTYAFRQARAAPRRCPTPKPDAQEQKGRNDPHQQRSGDGRGERGAA